MSKHCPKCQTVKPSDDFYARAGWRDGLSTWCKGCTRAKGRIATAKWAALNPGSGARRIAAKRMDPAYLAAQRKRERAEYAANREQILERKKKWWADHPETRKRVRAAWWGKKPTARALARRRYEHRKIKAMPSWVPQESIDAIYDEMKRRRAISEDVHVDHIIPLRGKSVSGLHVPWNLQIVQAAENLAKSNRLLPSLAA